MTAVSPLLEGQIMDCRPGCAACCVAITISSPLPEMPDGKPAGVRCAHLTDDNLCALFEDPRRPPVCSALAASPEMCGANAAEAFERLHALEVATAPASGSGGADGSA